MTSADCLTLKNKKRCWAEINLDNIAHNYRFFKNAAGGEIIAVVKADAYGHGAVRVSKRLEQEGCRFFAVSNIEEALALRQRGIKSTVMLLGYTPLCRFYTAYKNEITLCVNSLDYALQLDALAKKRGIKVKCQIKLDTGMGRMGFDALKENIFCELRSVYLLSNLTVTGIFSHFSSADGEKCSDRRYTKRQYNRFIEILSFLKSEGIDAGLTHHANSAAALRGGFGGLSASRIGLGLYGISPLPKLNALLKPAMELKAAMAFVKQSQKGRAISYGREYITKKQRIVATVCVGYADGYKRQLGKGAVMGVAGKGAPVIGRVTMDMVMLDVSGIPCKEQDTVTVLGKNALTVTQAAKKLKTIPYEIICGISSRVKRVYIGNSK